MLLTLYQEIDITPWTESQWCFGELNHHNGDELTKKIQSLSDYASTLPLTQEDVQWLYNVQCTMIVHPGASIEPIFDIIAMFKFSLANMMKYLLKIVLQKIILL